MATHARQQYFADESSLSKEKREFSIADEIQEKIDSVEEGAQVNKIETVKVNGTALVPDTAKAVNVEVPDVIDNLYTITADDALSAKQGKILYDYIQNLQTIGRFLSNWDTATGLPITNPSESPYLYKAGDYYRVSNVAASPATNYKPNGSSYTIGVASTTIESLPVAVSDLYLYDGTDWILLSNSGSAIAIDSSLSTTSTNPVENRVITNALNGKHPGEISNVAPSNPVEGMLWYDTVNDELKTYDGTTWQTEGTKMVVLEYGVSTWQNFIDAYNENAIVYCKVSSGSSGYRMAFMAYTVGTTVPTEVEFQYYRSRSSHSQSSTQLDEVYVYKLTNAGVWTTTQRDTGAEMIAGTGIGITFNSSGATINNTGVTSVNGNTGAVTLDADDISDSTTTNKFVTASDKTTWNNKLGVSTDTGNLLSAGDKLWLGSESDFSSIVSPDANTMYIQYVSDSPTPPSPGWQPGPNTVAYYPLDSVNTVNDLSGNNYNLTNNGNVTFGLVGGVDCATFGTSTPRGLVNTSANIISGQYTYLAWINMDLSSSYANGWARMFGGVDDWFVLCGELDNIPSVSMGPQLPPTNGVQMTAGWHLICFVGNTSDGSFTSYKDGVYVNSGTGVTGSRNGIVIGAKENSYSHNNDRFKGNMSAIIWENKQRTAQEVADYYDLTKANYLGTGNIQGMTQLYSTSFSYQYTRGTRMSNDGTILLVGFEGSGKLVEYSLSTPFDLSTKSEVASLSVGSCQTGYFNNDGTILTVGSAVSNQQALKQYSCPTPYHLTGATEDYSVVIGTSGLRQGFYTNNGNTLFIVNDKITQYTTGSAYNPTNLTQVYQIDDGPSYMGLAFNSDGTMYVTQDLSGNFKQYSAETPFNISANDTFLRTESGFGQMLGVCYTDNFYKMVFCTVSGNYAKVYDLPNS